jgi:hypothetical protein
MNFDPDQYETQIINGVNCVIIPEKVYKELLGDSELLEALYAAGVDNWQGFEIAKDSI